MTLHEETINLDEELARLRDEREELLEKTAELHPNDPESPRLQRRGKTLDTHIEAVEWARDRAHTDEALPTRDGEGQALSVWDEPAETLTFGSISGGEFAMIKDRVTTKAASLDLQATTGLSQVHTVAFGTVDAPYHDPDAKRKQQIAAVSKLPRPFLEWAESTLLDLSMVGNGSEQSFAAAVNERRQAKSKDSTTPT